MTDESVPEVKVKKKGGRPKGPSRLSVELAEANARLAKLEAAFAAKPVPNPEEDEVQARRLREAEAELEALRPRASRPTVRLSGPEPKHVPYQGLVRAKVDCAVGCFHEGPNLDKGKVHGDVFSVDVPVLWSDDPYEPVRVSGTREDGTQICEIRTDVAIVDWRWRQLTDPESRNPMARAI